MLAPVSPTNIQQIGQELAIMWNDGQESYLTLENLRRACPCAACGGEPDVMGNLIRPEVKYEEGSFELRGYQVIGGYALQPIWGDGHASGLYPFTFLRQLSAAAAPPNA
jgi:DUF971 family protein